jgi:hypothetical protein
MRIDSQYRVLAQEVQYLSALARQLRAEGPHIIVRHGHHHPETFCLPGETVEGISVHATSRSYPLHLGLTLLLLLDLLCRFRRTPLSATQIADILNSDSFYMRYGSNALGKHERIGTVTPASIRVNIARLRDHLRDALKEIGLQIDPFRVLVSSAGESNVALYRLRATVQIFHFDSGSNPDIATAMYRSTARK